MRESARLPNWRCRELRAREGKVVQPRRRSATMGLTELCCSSSGGGGRCGKVVGPLSGRWKYSTVQYSTVLAHAAPRQPRRPLPNPAGCSSVIPRLLSSHFPKPRVQYSPKNSLSSNTRQTHWKPRIFELGARYWFCNQSAPSCLSSKL